MYKRAAWCTLFVRHLKELGFQDDQEERLLHIAFHEWAADHRRSPTHAADEAFAHLTVQDVEARA